MNSSELNSIIHPTDFTPGDEGAFAHALRLGVAFRTVLYLLHVGGDGDESEWKEFPKVRETLSHWGMLPPTAHHRDLAGLGLEIKKVQKLADNPAETISQFVTTHEPDLVVLSTHQRQGFARLAKPGLAEAIARNAHTRTLFVPRRVPGFVSAATGAVTLRRILIPVDREPDPQSALESAAAFARALGVSTGTFLLLHVGDEVARPRLTAPEVAGWTTETLSVRGEVVDAILEASDEREADLIVMTTRGHHGFLDALRGSTTERVLRGAKCPLLAVPT